MNETQEYKGIINSALGLEHGPHTKGRLFLARLVASMVAQGVVWRKAVPDRISLEAERLVKTIPGGMPRPGQG